MSGGCGLKAARSCSPHSTRPASQPLRDNAVRCLADGGQFLGKFDATSVTDRTIVVIDSELSPDMMRRWLRDQGIVNQSKVRVMPMRGRNANSATTPPR